MTEPRLYTAEEARELREGTTPAPWVSRDEEWYDYDTEEVEIIAGADPCANPYAEIAKVKIRRWDDEGDPEMWANARLIAAAPDLAATVEHQAEEIEKKQSAIDLLARMTEWMQMDTVRAAGLDHMVQEDDDGDWGAIWDIIWERLKDYPRQARQIDTLERVNHSLRERARHQAEQIERLQAAIRDMSIPPNTAAEQIRRGTIREEDMND